MKKDKLVLIIILLLLGGGLVIYFYWPKPSLDELLRKSITDYHFGMAQKKDNVVTYVHYTESSLPHRGNNNEEDFLYCLKYEIKFLGLDKKD